MINLHISKHEAIILWLIVNKAKDGCEGTAKREINIILDKLMEELSK